MINWGRWYNALAHGLNAKSALMAALPIVDYVDIAVLKDTLEFRDGRFHLFMN